MFLSLAFFACDNDTKNNGGGSDPNGSGGGTITIPDTVPTASRVKDAGGNDTDWVQISAGSFFMGQTDGNAVSNEKPVHKVALGAFLICDHEVTQKEYQTYCSYGDSSPSNTYGYGDDFPAYFVNWYDAVVYCNLRSMAEGLTPCYSLNDETDVKKWDGIQQDSSGYYGPSKDNAAWNGIICDFNADGYRLPTEAEWECAARGGITDTDKNVWAGTTNESEVDKYAWYDQGKHNTVKKMLPNGYGLYDMSGNVWEWCWDWFNRSQYTTDSAGVTNPAGPSSGDSRVKRGGSSSQKRNLRVSYRDTRDPYLRSSPDGFRVCRTLKNGYAANGNIIINGIEYEKTSEQVIVSAGSQATVTGADSSWNTYYSGNEDSYKGVFIKNRTVRLSSFVMGKYEVTQELYEAVIGTNPSHFKTNLASGEIQKLRPVETVSWYDAVAFCNKLTEALGIKDAGGKIDYAYYSDFFSTTPYTSGNEIYYKKASKGYRLPTEAEWEFAARGGDASEAKWKFAFAGVQTVNTDTTSFASLQADNSLNSYGWYYHNSENKIHEVGRKTANSLNLYDMSGNVWEWCWDRYNADVTQNDSAYEVSGVVTNPTGPGSGSYRVKRGGSWYSSASSCAVSYRPSSTQTASYDLGFRVCRSQ